MTLTYETTAALLAAQRTREYPDLAKEETERKRPKRNWHRAHSGGLIMVYPVKRSWAFQAYADLVEGKKQVHWGDVDVSGFYYVNNHARFLEVKGRIP